MREFERFYSEGYPHGALGYENFGSNIMMLQFIKIHLILLRFCGKITIGIEGSQR